MNQNFIDFMDRMDANIGYKSVILPLLPKGYVKILDVGGGTGVLSHQMKLSLPYGKITLLDSNEEMLHRARTNNTADFYVSDMKYLADETFDAIVFCSVLHEIQNWEEVLMSFSRKLKKGGKIIIRDGYKSPSSKWEKIELVDPIDAILFWTECRGSIVGRLNVRFEDEYILGPTNDVRSFLQTYTWGWESLHREKHENHLFATDYDILDFFIRIGGFHLDTFRCTSICQQNYFKHLRQIAYIEEMWNTHTLIEITKE